MILVVEILLQPLSIEFAEEFCVPNVIFFHDSSPAATLETLNFSCFRILE